VLMTPGKLFDLLLVTLQIIIVFDFYDFLVNNNVSYAWSYAVCGIGFTFSIVLFWCTAKRPYLVKITDDYGKDAL